ncbi:MAG: hypothetical protein ACPGJI_05470 [Kangiellaceae bacterium]
MMFITNKNTLKVSEIDNITFKQLSVGVRTESRASTDGEIKSHLISKLTKEIKTQANTRITAIYPEWKQRNHMAEIIDIQNKELVALKAGTPYTLSADEIATIATAKTTKNQAFAIRSKSKQLETSLSSMTSEQLKAFDPTNDLNWT